MSVMKFVTGEVWEYDGLRLRFERHLSDDHLYFLVERTLSPFQIKDETGAKCAPTGDWAVRAFAMGRLVKVADRNGPVVRQLASKREFDAEQIHQLDKRARVRAYIVRALDKRAVGSISTPRLRQLLAEIWAEAPRAIVETGYKPSLRSVRRWLETRGAPGERQLRQMISMAGRVPRRRRLPAEVVSLLRKSTLRYWKYRSWSVSDAYACFGRLIIYINGRRCRGASGLPELKRPCFETFRTEIRRTECFDTYLLKYGENRAKARFKGNGFGLSATRALELGCLDHNVMDNIVVFDWARNLPMGRPTLTLLIDVRTRCIVGIVISFEPPSLYSVMECIKRANRPKLLFEEAEPRYQTMAYIFGRFDEIVVDNGLELSGISCEDALADAGISVRWAPIKSPTYKAIVERVFRTLNDLVVSKLPGATLNPKLLRELECDPSKDAVLTLDELEDLLWEAIAFYHFTKHSELGVPPAQLWMEDAKKYGIDVIADDRSLDKMMGAVQSGCQLSKAGIRFDGLRFHDPAAVTQLLEELVMLQPQRNQPQGSATAKVKIKYNPANLKEIHVWNARRNVYVTLPCTDVEYADGLSLSQHRIFRKWADAHGLEFSSEEDRICARASLVKHVGAFTPDLPIRRRRTVARAMTSPRVQAYLEHGDIALAHAPARHDGLAPVIAHETLSSHRVDEGRTSRRPPRGASKKQRGLPATSPRRAKQAGEALSYDFDDPMSSGWKGFEP